LFVPGVLSLLACPAQRQSVADKVYGLEMANDSACWRPSSAILGSSILDAGVGGSASASELLSQHCFVRAQAAQAAPNTWLESLHLGTPRGNPAEIFGAQFGAPLSIF
jgi:hypothetical protein